MSVYTKWKCIIALFRGSSGTWTKSSSSSEFTRTSPRHLQSLSLSISTSRRVFHPELCAVLSLPCVFLHCVACAETHQKNFQSYLSPVVPLPGLELVFLFTFQHAGCQSIPAKNDFIAFLLQNLLPRPLCCTSPQNTTKTVDPRVWENLIWGVKVKICIPFQISSRNRRVWFEMGFPTGLARRECSLFEERLWWRRVLLLRIDLMTLCLL